MVTKFQMLLDFIGLYNLLLFSGVSSKTIHAVFFFFFFLSTRSKVAVTALNCRVILPCLSCANKRSRKFKFCKFCDCV